MRLVIDLHDEVYNNMVVKNEYTDMDVIAVHNALMGAIHISRGHGEADVVDTVLEILDAVSSKSSADGEHWNPSKIIAVIAISGCENRRQT